MQMITTLVIVQFSTSLTYYEPEWSELGRLQPTLCRHNLCRSNDSDVNKIGIELNERAKTDP
jgi:hypothetical protein